MSRFDEDAVRTIIHESNSLFAECEDLMGGSDLQDLPDPVKVALTVYDMTIQRNKRCLLTYVNHRAGAAKQLRWDLGTVLPPEYRSNMHAHETSFFSKYDKLLTNYISDVGVDVTSDMMPPKELMVEIRVLAECGEIMTETGSVNLEKGTTHLLRRSDVESLVRQGYLEEIVQHESC